MYFKGKEEVNVYITNFILFQIIDIFSLSQFKLTITLLKISHQLEPVPELWKGAVTFTCTLYLRWLIHII